MDLVKILKHSSEILMGFPILSYIYDALSTIDKGWAIIEGLTFYIIFFLLIELVFMIDEFKKIGKVESKMKAFEEKWDIHSKINKHGIQIKDLYNKMNKKAQTQFIAIALIIVLAFMLFSSNLGTITSKNIITGSASLPHPTSIVFYNGCSMNLDIAVKLGENVQWINEGDIPIILRFENRAFTLAPNSIYGLKITEPKTYYYFCDSREGKILVY